MTGIKKIPDDLGIKALMEFERDALLWFYRYPPCVGISYRAQIEQEQQALDCVRQECDQHD
jgi:hypothetical protein